MYAHMEMFMCTICLLISVCQVSAFLINILFMNISFPYIFSGAVHIAPDK